jgi:hypothetical protein
VPTIDPFTPQVGGTVNITASTSSTVIAIPSGSGTQLRLVNTASVAVFVEFGASTQTASVGVSMPILPSANTPATIVTIDTAATGGANKMAFVAVTASATTTTPIYITRGEGF